MKTFLEYLDEGPMETIHTTTINLDHGGSGNFGIRVVFEVKHWKNAVWLHVIAANAGETGAYASKHYKLGPKTKVSDIYKWAKTVSKEAMPRSREFNDMFQRLVGFYDPMNEGFIAKFKKTMKNFHDAKNVSDSHFDDLLAKAEFKASGEQTPEKKKLKKFIDTLKKIDLGSSKGRIQVAHLEKRFLPLLKSMHVEAMDESVRFVAGDWIEQQANGVFARVVEVRPNGKIKVVSFNTDRGSTFSGKASIGFAQNWFPAATLADEKKIPAQVVKKINAKFPN